MKKTEIQINNKVNLILYNFLDESVFLNDKEKFIDSITPKLDYNEVGFGGWKDKGGFVAHLKNWIFPDIVSKESYPSVINNEEIVKITENVLKRCSSFLDNERIWIYIFPTKSKFAIEKMNGVSGRCIWKGVIYINIFPSKDWQKYLQYSLTHELAHAVNNNYSISSITVGQGIIFEGLAEHFREKIIGGERALWTKSVSKEEAMKILEEIKNRINYANINLYRDVFYGTGKYPLWAGYTIGYYLVEDYLKDKKNVDWKRLLRENPKSILKEILKN